MRNTYLLLLVLALSPGVVKAQQSNSPLQVISDFEDLALAPDSYWNGSDLSGGYISNLAFFPNDYNPDWMAWNQWAYSSMADDTTAGFLNQYSAITASGYDPAASGGSNYAVAYVISDFLTNELIPVPVRFADNRSHYPDGFYVTNGTYPALAMESGDDYSKKFGGESGDDPDYFKLMVWGMLNGTPGADTVEFFLADYRFANNDEDYIVKTWEWVDLSSLGLSDSLMFTLESTDVGMFGMNTPAFFCIDNFTVQFNSPGGSPFISEVSDYTPGPGQHINAAPWGYPASMNTIAGGIDGSLSLGAYGGHVSFSFDHPVENDPDNPYGIDLTIFGNAMTDLAEPAQVLVSKDVNWNGIMDDPWYRIAGSDHFFSDSENNCFIEYFNPGGPEDIPWESEYGETGFIYTNPAHTQPYYPQNDSFPIVDPLSYILSGTRIQGSIDTTNPAFVKSHQRAFGYADNHPRGSAPYNIPDNPYTAGIENSGGDAIDISWAVDSMGNYVELDMIHFVQVHTAVVGDLGWLGEVSTEITGAIDVDPDPSITGPTDIVVIKDLPAVVTTPSIQLEAFAFLDGRYDPDAEIEWFSYNGLATIDDNDVLHLEESGTYSLSAYLADDPSVETLVEYVVDFTYSVPEFSSSHLHVFPNPARDRLYIAGTENARVEIISLSGQVMMGMENYDEKQELVIDDLPTGIYLLRISSEGKSHVHKLMKH
jgi:hypothetical protein